VAWRFNSQGSLMQNSKSKDLLGILILVTKIFDLGLIVAG
jgi:hypothetical protein